MVRQLPLDVRLRDGAAFQNFYSRDGEILARLRALAAGQAAEIYLWGKSASGKTHLLEAVCRHGAAAGVAVAYVPLDAARAAGVTALEGLERAQVLCLDEVPAVAGDRPWETALFQLYDRRRERGQGTVVCATGPPGRIGLTMPELVSRLSRGLVYRLTMPDEAGRRQALRERAANRGLVLGDAVLEYLWRRYPRDLRSLFCLLERIDSLRSEEHTSELQSH